jgi:uncharacterized repeat protein (TIGR03803 family)
MTTPRRLPGWSWFRSILLFATLAASCDAFSRAANPPPSTFLRNHFYPWDTVEGRDGSFYGTLSEGKRPGGSIYVLKPKGTLRYLHSFASTTNGGDLNLGGSHPHHQLGVGPDGALYGSTRFGGAFANGVLFRYDPQGAFTALYHCGLILDLGEVLAASDGELYAVMDRGVLRLSKDGRQVVIPIPGDAIRLVETANGAIIVGTYTSGFGGNGGALWRLNASDEFEIFADVGYLPHRLVPLPDGGLLCMTEHRLLQVSAAGMVTVIHDFQIPFEGLLPLYVTVAQDGTYIGSTQGGGLERQGTVFQIDPVHGTFTLLAHLPAPGIRGKGPDWMTEVFQHHEAAAAGNRPPMTRDDIVESASIKADTNGLPRHEIRVLRNDSDADGDPLSITAVSVPEHGVAELDSTAQTIRYTANTSAVMNDRFTYTVADGSGGTSIGHVVVRAEAAGEYRGDVKSPADPATGDPGTTVGSLIVSVSSKRVATARLELLGRTFRFKRRFNEANRLAVPFFFNPRLGRSAGIQLWLRPDGSAWTIEATVLQNGLPYSASCTAVGLIAD